MATGKKAKGASAPGGTVQGAAFGGAKYGILKFYTPQLSVLFTVYTNAIVVTIRISIGDLIAGMGAATKTFAPGGKRPRAATGEESHLSAREHESRGITRGTEASVGAF